MTCNSLSGSLRIAVAAILLGASASVSLAEPSTRAAAALGAGNGGATPLLAPRAAPDLGGLTVRLTGNGQQVVRRGPAYSYAILGLYPPGSTFQVIARIGEWFNVRLSEQETGWVHASRCELRDDLSALEFRPNPRLYSRLGAFVLTAYAGGYAFDRKSNSLVLGGRLGYYLLSFLEVEGGVAWSHISRPREVVESLFGVSLENEEFHMLFYHMNIICELLPGRQVVPFVTAGAGSTIMQGRTESGLNFGAGTALFISKRTAMRWEFRDYRFAAGSRQARRTHNNIEFSFGTSYLF